MVLGKNFRLPLDVRPVRYSAHVAPDLSAGSFEGRLELEVRLEKPRREIPLGSDYALGKEQVMLGLRINVGNSPAIAQNVDGELESWHSQVAGDDGESLMGGTDEIGFRGGLGEDCEGK